MKTRPWSRRARAWLATIGILFVATACSGAAGDRSSPSAAISTSTSTPAPTQAATAAATTATAAASTPAQASTPALPPGVVPLVPGPHTAQVMGTGSYPRFTVDVPEGWFDFAGLFVLKYPSSPHPVLGLSVWDVGQVFRDPCHWQGTGFDPGPSVNALVTALVAQPMRSATKPRDVTLAGYHGRYLELSVPDDIRMSKPGEFDACDLDEGGYRDFQGWLGNGKGNRHEQVPGQIDRLWVLDVKGKRLMVDATYSPDASQADRDELERVVQSLRFVAP